MSIVVRDYVIPDDELRWRFSRSQGPGGQSVNTTDSRVELSYNLVASAALPDGLRERARQHLTGRLVDGVLTITASEHRSQLRNRQAAMSRLQAVLLEATAPPRAPRRPTRPSKRARERRLERKHARAGIKRLRRRPLAEP